MKTLIITGLLSMVPALAVANGASEALADKLISESPKLGEQETAALALAKRWQSNSDVAAQARAGADGSVQFTHGAGQPTLVCAVMQICDVQLQPGERITAMHLGDSVRWMVEPATSGVRGQIAQHLVIKPLDAGLDTTMLVTTDRRTYHFRLRSTRSDYLPKVSFQYADEIAARWAALQRSQQQAVQQRTLPASREVLDELDFNYKVAGRAPWKPVRVYNDGTRTTIEMPQSLKNHEAPVLYVVRGTPGILSKEERVMVNYRVKGNRFIVDTVFDKAVLLAGVGRNQVSVTLTREQ